MVTGGGEQTDDAEDDFGEDEPAVAGLSFFHLHDAAVHPIDDVLEADDRVCARVWSMFAKKSNSDGFDCRSVNQKAASRWLAEQRAAGKLGAIKGAMTMQQQKRGALLAAVRDAHAAFTKKSGKPPTPTELFEAVGPSGKSVENVRMAAKRAGLALTLLSRGEAASRAGAKNAAKLRGETPKPGAPVKPALVKLPPPPAPPAAPSPAPTAQVGRQAGMTVAASEAVLVDLVRERLAVAEREVAACRAFLAAFEA